MNNILLYKAARVTNFERHGPANLEQALNLLLQAKAIGNPDDQYLRKHDLGRNTFEQTAEKLYEATKGQDKFNASKHVPDPKINATIGGALGGIAGSGLGSVAGIPEGIAGLLIGGLGGAGYGYLDAAQRKKNMLNTLKVLREYGINDPSKLRKALPLLQRY